MHLLLAFSIFAAAAAPEPAFPLENELEAIAADRLFQTADVSVQVVNVRTGEEVWARNPDKPLNPASTTKVLTAATALNTLGPSYTFETRVLARVAPDARGVIKGDLVVKGGADPTMVVEKLWKLARDLELAGITKVEGDLILDESMFGDDHELPGWDKGADLERGPAYFPSVSALALNFNTAALVIRPGPEVGKPAVVVLETEAGEYLKVASSITTSRAGYRPRISIDREVSDDATSFTLTGAVPLDDSVRKYYRTVGDPTKYFGEAFRVLLADRGIEVTGTSHTGVTKDSDVELASLSSPPLTTVLMDMNKYSSNFMAEHVLRTVGAEVEGKGTTEAGVKVMRRYLTSIGVPEDTYVVVNGSGLAKDAALTPSALNAVLLDMAKDPRVGHEFVTSLAIAGRDGTLRRRLSDKPSQVRGKTGTLSGVHCLAGYLESDEGDLYAFAFLVNGFRGGSSRVKQLHDDFARRMFTVTTDGAADESAP